MELLSDRIEAGRRLAAALKDAMGKDAIVLAIPRGGVVVGFEVAHTMDVPLDLIIPRKIGAPNNPELAIGAVTEDGTIILDDKLVEYLEVSKEYIKEESERQRLEIERRSKLYRGDAPYPTLKNREVVIVDDGLATGSTMKAAVVSVRKRGAKTIVVAVPVGPSSTVEELKKEADDVICLQRPEPFYAIGQFYEDFSQTSDEDVRRLLKLSRQQSRAQESRGRTRKMNNDSEGNKKIVKIPSGKATIEGNLTVPRGAKRIVIFAHGSGSGRFSPRNRLVANVLEEAGIATLLIDLLTEEEEQIDMRTGRLRFDIDLLAQRLMAATEWVKKNPKTKDMAVGYFGASTGAAAALIAAAKLPEDVRMVVSRGGRPDLALEYLPRVKAPVLLIVGGRDTVVIDLNKEAMKHLRAEKRFEIIPGASHLFEEPGKLEEVARLATAWFSKQFKNK
jgi:putative phosphoribosyl transferase